MKVYHIKKKNGEILRKWNSTTPRTYYRIGHARKAIAMLAEEERSKARVECYEQRKRDSWDSEMFVFCRDNTPSAKAYGDFYEIVEKEL